MQGLSDKPVITIWNKIDAIPGKKEFLKFEAAKRAQTVALSAKTGEGIDSLIKTLETTLSSQMVPIECFLPYEAGSSLLDTLHRWPVCSPVRVLHTVLLLVTTPNHNSYPPSSTSILISEHILILPALYIALLRMVSSSHPVVVVLIINMLTGCLCWRK